MRDAHRVEDFDCVTDPFIDDSFVDLVVWTFKFLDWMRVFCNPMRDFLDESNQTSSNSVNSGAYILKDVLFKHHLKIPNMFLCTPLVITQRSPSSVMLLAFWLITIWMFFIFVWNLIFLGLNLFWLWRRHCL